MKYEIVWPSASGESKDEQNAYLWQHSKPGSDSSVPSKKRRGKLEKLILNILVIVQIGHAIGDSQPIELAFNGLKSLVPTTKEAVISVYARDIRLKGDVSSGSGFLCQVEKTVVAVTCYHVIEPMIKLNYGIYVGLSTKNGFNKYRCDVLQIDTANDIAILLPRKDPKENIELKTLIIDTLSISPDSGIVEGTSIIAAGFPFGIGLEYDKYNPVFTTGFIAQRTNDSIYLADITINPGNSGGPVFDIPNRKFIGMVKGYRNNNILLYSKDSPQPVAVPTNSGLANIVSSTKIRKLLSLQKLNRQIKKLLDLEKESTGRD
jgi:S1-C subfamily serine protease